MSDEHDPEMVALSEVLRALSGLEKHAQRRVLAYAGERLKADFDLVDSDALLENLNQALDAINKAAQSFNEQEGAKVNGVTLMNVVQRMYEHALEAGVETT